ncbi:MAG: glycosyltransferase family 4 protein [Pseudomonadota bacterium]
MKQTINLIDDPRPGGIRSLLDDMSSAGIWGTEEWQIRNVNPVRPIVLGRRYDTIVVHYSMAWRKLPALFLLRKTNPHAKIVIVEHHYTAGFEQRHIPSVRRFRTLLRTCYRLADEVVAVSAAQARWLRAAGVVSADKLQTIPSCRNYAKFLEIPRVEKSVGPIVVGALGRIEHSKGFDLLVSAIAGLPDVDYQLKIAGDGSALDALKQQAANLDNVEFIGHLDDPSAFLGSCDVLVMPSRFEAFGLVCAEAKACGLPVIVSDVDGLPEQVQDCGVVIEPECEKSIRQALRFVSRPSRLHIFSRKARASVVNAWSDYLTAWSRVLAH